MLKTDCLPAPNGGIDFADERGMPEPETEKKPEDLPDAEPLALKDIAQQLLEECRMVLPGIQALFGFQMIAVFNESFARKLSPLEQRLHLLAIAMVVVSIALVMTPAAYHRLAEPESVSHLFTRLSSRLLLLGMGPLAVAIALDFYLVARLISNNGVASAAVAAVLGFLYLLMWAVLPCSRRLQRIVAGKPRSR